MVWLTWPPPLLRTAVRMSSGISLMSLISVFDADACCRSGWLSERGVQIGDVRRVVLVVVQLHRLLVDIRLQCRVGIR